MENVLVGIQVVSGGFLVGSVIVIMSLPMPENASPAGLMAGYRAIDIGVYSLGVLIVSTVARFFV